MNLSDYEVITVNTLPGKPRRKKFQGRDYLVVDATLLMEGVLNGSRGPLYYPPDEIAANPGIWNHVPIVVWHPKDSDGNPTLARQPEILEEYGIGLLFNDRYEYDGRKRLAEAWFDEKRTTEFDNRLPDQYKLLPRINAGKAVELSTGLHTANYPAPAESVFNAADGTPYPYIAVARNYRPDHLAALPDQRGACSTQYGCGFNVNNTPINGEDVENAKKLTGGRWITTDSGNHLYIRGGNIVAGNPHVVAAAKGGDKKDSKKPSDNDDDDKDGEGRYPSKFNKSITYGNKDDRDSDDAYFAREIKKADDEVKSIKAKLAKAEAKMIEANPGVADLTKRLHDVNATIAIETEKRDESRRRIEELKKLLKPKKKSTNNEQTSNSEHDELTIDDIVEILNYQPRSANTGKFKSPGSGYGKDPWQSAAQKGAMSLSDEDIADGTSASAEVGEKGHNPISWVADEGKWEKAKAAAREGGYQEGSDQFWAVTAHIYKQMGGKKKAKVTTNAKVDWQKIGNDLSKQGLMPGYGQIFLNDENEDTLDHVWYVGGDGDENGFSKIVETTLKNAGAKEVTYESEGFPPKNQSWVQVYPKKRAWVTTNEGQDTTDNSNPEGCNQYTGPGCSGNSGASSGKSISDYKVGDKVKDHDVPGVQGKVVKVTDTSVHVHFEDGDEDFPTRYNKSDLREGKLIPEGQPHPYANNSLSNPITSEDVSMAKPDDIKYLTANCECWKGKDTILNGMTDAEVASWKKYHEKAKKDEHVANAVVNSGFTVNSENRIQAVENAGECPKCGGKMKDGKCEKCGYTQKATMNTLNLDDASVLDAVSNKLFGLTANDAKAVMGSAKKIEQRERFSLVHKLVANVKDETVRNSKVTELLKLPTGQLELLVSFLPNETTTHNANQPNETELFMQTFYGSGSRIGAQGAPHDFVGNRGQHIEDKPDVEGGPRVGPTLNYDEVSDVGRKIRKRNSA